MSTTYEEFFLCSLEDEELKILITSVNTDTMLMPLKKNSKAYAKYMSRLGRADAKSPLVKANLPGIVFELFKKSDPNIKKLLTSELVKLKQVFVDIISEYSAELTPRAFANMEPTECIRVLTEIEKLKKDNLVDIDLFILQLKFHEVAVTDEWKVETKRLWVEKKEKAEAERRKQKEFEASIKEMQDSLKSETIRVRKELEGKLHEADVYIGNLEAQIEKQKAKAEELQGKIDEQKKEIKKFRDDYSSVQEAKESAQVELSERQKKISALEKEIGLLKKQIGDERKKYEDAWYEELAGAHSDLIESKEQLTADNIRAQQEIDAILDRKASLEVELENIRKDIADANKSLMAIRSEIEDAELDREDIRSKSRSSEAITQVGNGPKLYVEPGTVIVTGSKCEKYGEYENALITNLESISYDTDADNLEDIFNAALGTGLVPTLYGFSARRAAIALIAARYSEIPTIISIPAGYSDVDALSSEIDEAETETVVIEDLFGRMNEDIILPVLRRDIDKKLVFCAESIDNFKYLDAHFLNYIQLIKVAISTHKRMLPLVFADANDLFESYEMVENVDYARSINKLLRNIGLSEAFIHTRTDMLLYLYDVAQLGLTNTLEVWMNHELISVLTDEQKKELHERFMKDSRGIKEDLIERLAE